MAVKNKYLKDSEPQQWKKKYYAALDDIEHKENQWQQIESLLRHGLVRISLGVDGENTTLNILLETLRTDIRKGKDSLALRNQIDKITDFIRSLEIQENPQNDFSNEKIIKELINQIDWPYDLLASKRVLAKEFKDTEYQSLEKFIDVFTKLINGQLNKKVVPVTHEEVVREEGVLAEKVTKQSVNSSPELSVENNPAENIRYEHVAQQTVIPTENTVSVSTEPALAHLLLSLLNQLPESLLIPAVARKLKLKVTEVETHEAASLIIDELVRHISPLNSTDFPQPAAEILSELLEQIVLPEDLAVAAEEIRLSLQDSAGDVVIKNGLERTVDLVNTIQLELQKERKELQEFLEKIGERLQEIDQELKNIAGINDSHDESFGNVNSAINETIDEINESVGNEDDIDRLKSSVKSHVIMIRHHMDTYFEQKNIYTEDTEKITRKLARELIAVKNEAERLREQLRQRRVLATHDSLTRIPNKLAYEEWIAQAHERFEQYDAPYILMFWDIDAFRHINNEFGKQAGDKVLRIVAQVLMENIREADFLARYSGEKFVIIVPGASLKRATEMAEKIRLAIESCAFHFQDKPVKITASAGLAEVSAGNTIEQLFLRVYQALKQAKATGRNCCIVV